MILNNEEFATTIQQYNSLLADHQMEMQMYHREHSRMVNLEATVVQQKT
jgi:hypothetical protein